VALGVAISPQFRVPRRGPLYEDAVEESFAITREGGCVSAPCSDSFGEVPQGSEFAARVYAAINARDRGAIKGLCAPDIVVGTTVEAYRGPEAVLEWLDEGDDAFNDFSVELLEVEELAGHVLASMRQRGRGKASGAEVDHRFTHVWTIRDGRAIRMQSFADHDDAVRYAQAF
jgi:ketosteroid isomerase-like protein